MTSGAAAAAAALRESGVDEGRRTIRRTVGRGPGLPSGRAALGALLVSAAAVGLYTASTRASAHPMGTYLVAARDLPPGHTLVAGDLRSAQLDLTDDLAGRAFGDRARVEGATTLGPVGAGELFQAGALIRKAGGASSRELSIPVDPARAVAGSLRAGERIDVVATFGSGSSSTTEVVLRNGLVTDVVRSGTNLSSSGTMVVTFAVNTEAEQIAVARALNNGELLLVRAPAAEATNPLPVASGVAP